MMSSKRVLRTIRTSLKRLFPSRNIIIVSDHKIDHYPMSGWLQVGAFAGTIALFSWISFSTGSYMAAQDMLVEKDRKLRNVAMANKEIEKKFSLLRRDMLKLHDGEGDKMSDYDKFILDQYASDGASAPVPGAIGNGFFKPNLYNDGNEKLHERLGFLEKRVDELKAENLEFLSMVHEKTQGKIEDFESIIAMTGLDSDELMELAAASPAAGGKVAQRPARPSDADEESIEVAPTVGHDNQGGPYVPEELRNIRDLRKELLSNVDFMVQLRSIVTTLPLTIPVTKEARTTSGFGVRVDPFNGRWAMHSGVDFSAPDGAEVHATNDGIVSFTGWNGAYGNMVDVDHGLGISTRYGHLKSISATEGQWVKKGDIIGIQGSTGRSTGSHVHYEVRFHDKALNPRKFIEAGNKYVSKK